MNPDKEPNYRTESERKEYEEGKRNPHGFRKGALGSAEEIAAFEEGQKAGRAMEEGKTVDEMDDSDKDDLETKR